MAEVKKTTTKTTAKAASSEQGESKIKTAVKKTVEKKVVVKSDVKAEKQTEKVETRLSATKGTAIGGQSTLTITVVDVTGKENGTMKLPAELFGVKINPTLMAQAVRVYLANQRQGNASTKTRGEVDGSTRKIYRQKGTGRARHGGVRAPIFVKGGIAHGPKLRDYSLSLPTKMKRAALFSALTTQLQNGNVVVVAGLEKVGPKTKNMAQALKKVGSGKKALVVMPELLKEVYTAGRNIEGITLTPAQELSSYAVLGAGKLVLMKEAIEVLQKTFVKSVRQAKDK